jgi:hypothetical protein
MKYWESRGTDARILSTLATDPPGQLDILGHDGDTLGVDSAQVGVLEQANQIGLAGLLWRDKIFLHFLLKLRFLEIKR